MENFDAKEYINAPNWQKSRLGLERITKLLELLGNPHKSLKFIHVAGTNGKGSTCAYISQMFIESGYKTGRFTSPYIFDFNERICINNQPISNDDLTNITLQVKEKADTFAVDDHPTEFELMTAVAFLYYKQQNCDIVICEVGMGGRLDSTNVLSSDEVLASVITPISLDHTEFLGDNLSAIAKEKAGIIKPGVPVIRSWQYPEAERLIVETAERNNCIIRLVVPDVLNVQKVDLKQNPPTRTFSYLRSIDLKTQLLAIYQPYNAALAIEIAWLLYEQFPKITPESVARSIYTTKWSGRFEIVEKNPYVVVDGAHNLQGADALVDSLLDVFGQKKFIFIMGVLADKDYVAMVKKICPIAKHVYTVTPPNPRALEASDLSRCFINEGVGAQVVEISKAIGIAKESASDDDVICAFGSLYSIASLR